MTIEQARKDVELKDDVQEYIETLAHELRTPITGIRLNCRKFVNTDGY